MLMAAGQYVTGVTRPKLAAKWGITEMAVSKLATEASRRIRAQFEEPMLRAKLMATLDGIVSFTSSRKEYRTTIEAVKVLADLAGVSAPQRIEVSGGVSLEEIERARKTAEANASDDAADMPPADDEDAERETEPEPSDQADE